MLAIQDTDNTFSVLKTDESRWLVVAHQAEPQAIQRIHSILVVEEEQLHIKRIDEHQQKLAETSGNEQKLFKII